MAKTIPAGSLDTLTIGQGQKVLAGDDIVYDDFPTAGRALNRLHNKLYVGRTKAHVCRSWMGFLGANWPYLRSTSWTVYETRLEFRVTPRIGVTRLMVRVNADTNGNDGRIRVSSGVGGTPNVVFAFFAAYAPTTEQWSSTLTVTGGQTETTELITVEMGNWGTSGYVDLRELSIFDCLDMAVGELP